MKILCVIPARGGSKRLPRKNIIDFKGKPIISYTIEAAIKTKLFERVIVSTEDEEIANISKKYGAEIVKRSKKLASDNARIIDVCLDLLETEALKGVKYNILCCLLPTAPLRNTIDILKTVELVKNKSCDYGMAVTNFHFAPHQALKLQNDSDLSAMWPNLVTKRASELPNLVVDNGSTYVVRVKNFIKDKTLYGESFKGHLMPRERSVDIDLESDYLLANFYANKIIQ
jgi:pseudaminic acid cytidylyltransferase